MVVGTAGFMHIKGAFATVLACFTFGAAAGITASFWGFTDDSWVWIASAFALSGLLSLLAGARSRAAQQRLRRLMRDGVEHVAVMHDQGYTEATWVEYSGSVGTVVLRFIDAAGHERFVSRGLTQFRDDPLPNGSQIKMYWDPSDPADTKKMVFVREVHGRTEYF